MFHKNSSSQDLCRVWPTISRHKEEVHTFHHLSIWSIRKSLYKGMKTQCLSLHPPHTHPRQLWMPPLLLSVRGCGQLICRAKNSSTAPLRMINRFPVPSDISRPTQPATVCLPMYPHPPENTIHRRPNHGHLWCGLRRNTRLQSGKEIVKPFSCRYRLNITAASSF